uniref:Uncharacterized protein n=1 Tax=Noccaea caerulescens TaxID=107243 RepID=A0A1J3GJ96_NOCCA
MCLHWLPSAASGTPLSLAPMLASSNLRNLEKRNRRFHQGLSATFQSVLVHILNVVKNKAIALHNLGSKHGEALMLCWSRS